MTHPYVDLDRRSMPSSHSRAQIHGVHTPWAKRIVCLECHWSRHVESQAEDGGARTCRRTCREHRLKTGHKRFGIYDGRVKERPGKKKKKEPKPDARKVGPPVDPGVSKNPA